MIEQGENYLIFERTKKLVVHRALRVHTCGESCTGEGEMHFRGSFCFVWLPGFLVFLITSA